MRIESVTLTVVRLPLRHKFQTSSHRKDHLDHVLVCLRDTEGNDGWGEIASPSDPFYCSETVDTAWLVATTYLLPAVLGAEVTTPEDLEARWGRIRGHEFAKAGFSIAAWSLWAKGRGVSLAQALGGTRGSVVAGVSLGIEPTVEDLLEQVDLQVAAGYPRVKLKIAPGWDLEPVAAVRAAHPDLDLHVDANGAYAGDAGTMERLAGLDEFGLTMVEQPFAPRDFVSHARFQQMVSTPVCLDESVVDVHDLATMVELGAGRVLNIKVSRVGGLTVARRMHDTARAAGIPVWCGGMHEFGVGRAANLAISSLPGFTLPSDVSASHKYFERDIIDPPIIADHGVVDVPGSAGIGVDIDRQWVESNTLRTVTERVDTPRTLPTGGPTTGEK